MATKNAETQQGVRVDIALADEQLLASLGYKQEFQRAFTGLEVRYFLPFQASLSCAVCDSGC